MGEFAGLIDKLSDERLDALTAEDMGVHLNLNEVVALLRLVRKDLEAGEGLSPAEITQSLRAQLLNGNFANQIDQLVAAMTAYGPQTQNPQNERTTILNQAGGLRDLVINHLRPIVRTDEAKIQDALDKATSALDRAQQMVDDLTTRNEELAKQQSALATSSASKAASGLVTFYEEQAKSHAKTASTFFIAGAVAAVLLTVLTVVFFFKSPPDYTTTKTAEQWIEVGRATVARLALLSISGFAVAFCVRNYRVNMHLQVLNRRRENALNTFGPLQAAVTSEDARNIVVGELVRSIFTSEETGYLGTETERTVIEQPGGAGMLLTAMSRQGQ